MDSCDVCGTPVQLSLSPRLGPMLVEASESVPPPVNMPGTTWRTARMHDLARCQQVAADSDRSR